MGDYGIMMSSIIVVMNIMPCHLLNAQWVSLPVVDQVQQLMLFHLSNPAGSLVQSWAKPQY